MSHIFISYSRKDLDSAQRIVTALAAQNLDTWIDWKSIPKGEDWEQEIYRGIEEAEAFLFLISPHSVASEMCNREIDHAVRNGKRILPIFIADVEDRALYSVTQQFLHPAPKEEINRRNFILCRPAWDSFDTALDDIQKTIHTDFDWLRFHTRLQIKALEWERNGNEDSFLLNGKELTDIAAGFVAGAGKDPAPTDLQRDYLRVSQEDEERRRQNEDRRRRQITLGLGIGLLVTAVLGSIAWVQRNEANSQRSRAESASTLAIAQQSIAQTKEAEAVEQARIAHSRELAAIALNQLSVDQERSLLIALAANEQTHTLEANDALRRALQGFQAQATLQQCPLQGDYAEDQILGLSYAFSGDGSTLAVFCNLPPRQIRVFEVGSAKTILTIPVSDQTQYIFNLSFSADASTLVYTERGFGGGSLAGGAVVWDLARGEQVFSTPAEVFGTYGYLSGAGSKLWFFAPDSFEFDFRPVVFVYDIASQERVAAIPVLTLSAPLAEDQIAVQTEDSWALYNMTTLQEQELAIRGEQRVEGPGGRDELLIRDGQTVRILNLRTGEAESSPPIASLPNPNQYYFLEISPDHSSLALVIDNRIQLIRFEDPASTLVLEGHESPIGWVEFSADSRLLISTSLDTTCRIWDVSSGTLISTINKVLRARFSPDKKRLVIQTEEGNLVLWDLPNRGEVASVNAGQPVAQAWFSADGQQILLTTDAGETMSWDWQGSGLKSSPASTQPAPAKMSRLSPDGRFLAMVDQNNMLQLFEAGSSKVLFESQVSTDQVNDLQFSPDSTMLILALGSPFVTQVQGDPGWMPFRTPGELEQTANLWDLRTMEQVAILRGSTDAVNSASFSPDSKYVVTASNDGFVRVYLAHVEDLELYARQRIVRNPPEFTCEERVAFLREKRICPTGTPPP